MLTSSLAPLFLSGSSSACPCMTWVQNLDGEKEPQQASRLSGHLVPRARRQKFTHLQQKVWGVEWIRVGHRSLRVCSFRLTAAVQQVRHSNPSFPNWSSKGYMVGSRLWAQPSLRQWGRSASRCRNGKEWLRTLSSIPSMILEDFLPTLRRASALSTSLKDLLARILPSLIRDPATRDRGPGRQLSATHCHHGQGKGYRWVASAADRNPRAVSADARMHVGQSEG